MLKKPYYLFFLCCTVVRSFAVDADGDGFPDMIDVDEDGMPEFVIPDQRILTDTDRSTLYYDNFPGFGYAYYGSYTYPPYPGTPTTPVDPGTPTTPVDPGTPTTPVDPAAPTIDNSSETASAIKSGLSNGTSSSLMETMSNFRVQPVFVSHTRDLFGCRNKLWSNQSKGSTDKRFESILRAAQENGPISVEKRDGGDTYRLWVIPFVTFLNNMGKNPSRYTNGGFASGGQYNNDEYRYTIAAFLGGQTGKETSKLNSVDRDKTKGFLFGSYASWGAWKGGRLDLFYMHARNNHDKYSFIAPSNAARGEFKSKTDLCDVMVSHNFKIPGDVWSIRASMGHYYVNSKNDSYQETGARNYIVPESKSRSYEIYPGVGARYNHQGDAWRLRVTGVYEYGYEYKSKVSPSPSYIAGAIAPHSYNLLQGIKKRSHYLTLYATVNNFSGLKFFFGGFTTLTKKQVATTITAKAEYRW